MLGPFATGVYNQCMCDINCIQVTPSDNRNGWLGVKHQITYLPYTGADIKCPPSLFFYLFWLLKFHNRNEKLLSIKLEALLYV